MRDVEYFEPRTGQIVEAPPLNEARWHAGASAVGNRIYAYTGAGQIKKWVGAFNINSIEWFEAKDFIDAANIDPEAARASFSWTSYKLDTAMVS